MYEKSNVYTNLFDQTQFRLKRINEIKGNFIAEICEREAMSKELSQYIVAFDYFDKILSFYLQHVMGFLLLLLPLPLVHLQG